MRRVADTDLSAIAEALGDASGESSWWYDPATGAVELGLPDWMALDDTEEADDPEARGLVPIGFVGSRHAYRDMVAFAAAVGDERAADRLTRALEGRGAFRRFRDTLHEYPDLREHWLVFSRACEDHRAIDWLVDAGYADPADAEAEQAARSAIMTSALAAVGGSTDLELEEADVARRWAEVVAAVEAGRAVAVVRDDRLWARITPA